MYIYIMINKYIFVFIYTFNSMEAYLRLLVSCRLHTTIISQKKKDFREIERIEKL